MVRSRSRPGLAKTSGLPLFVERRAVLWRSSDDRWRELLECADVMSEGATRQEGGKAVYYGTTSFLITSASLQEKGCVLDARTLAALTAADPHVRVRALRVACLEAQLRAEGPLRCVHAELTTRADARGLELTVDVEAPIQASGGASLAVPAARRSRR